MMARLVEVPHFHRLGIVEAFRYGLHLVAIVCYSDNMTTLTMNMIMTIAFVHNHELHVLSTSSPLFVSQSREITPFRIAIV